MHAATRSDIPLWTIFQRKVDAESMSWQEGVAVALVLLGLGARAFLVSQQPAFWIEFGVRLGHRIGL